MRTYADPEMIRTVYREEQRRILMAQASSLFANVANLDSCEPDDFKLHAHRLAGEIVSDPRNRDDLLEKRFQQIAQRHHVILQ